jgi:AraC-like DNA-binding protein
VTVNAASPPTRCLTETRDHPAGHAIGAHAHADGQLTVVLSGTSQISDGRGWWLAPPGWAIWVPPLQVHEVRVSHASTVIVVALDAAPRLRELGCCSLPVSPLMRELAGAVAAGVQDVACQAMSLELLAALAAQAARSTAFFVPQGRDARLRRVIAQLTADPGDKTELPDLARMASASERTLARLFVRETGMTFGRWRAHLRLVSAIDRLARGASITRVAHELGYNSASSFTTMFTRALGHPPGRYLRTALHEELRSRSVSLSDPLESDRKPPCCCFSRSMNS